jgi:hypothetical protein
VTNVTTDPELVLAVEDLQERILEMLQTEPVVQELVMQEVRQRFPEYSHHTEHDSEEIVCMCQLLVYRRILGEIA